MFLLTIKNRDTKILAVAVFLAWEAVFLTLYFTVSFLIPALLAGLAIYLTVRFSNWALRHRDNLEFVNETSSEGDLLNSRRIKTAHLNKHLVSVMFLFSLPSFYLPLAVAHLAHTNDSGPGIFIMIQVTYFLGILYTTNLIYTIVRRLHGKDITAT